MPEATGNNTHGEITPEEITRVQAAIRGPEQAPSSRQQLGQFANWKQVQDQLGQPFNNERVPLNRLKLMRRDPMIGFGLHFTKTPLVRAPWYMKSVDAQVAGFMDAALRPVVPSLIIQCLLKLDFGFQAIAKRFTFDPPQGTYEDESGNEQPVWAVGGTTGQGGIEPVSLKPFVPLPPESVEPIWDEKTGEFAGINYKPPKGGSPAGTGGRSSGQGGSEGAVEIDLYHSLWATNEQESVFGNPFGYPRLGYAFPYWWSYWFRWAIADRAFEKKGDPSIVVRHPEGEIEIDGQTISNAEYALLMADRLRSGSGIALPSTPYMGLDDKPSAAKEWDIEFLKGGVELEPFDKSFSYLDVLKLRAIFVPEQALIEGGGGTSSRNVAKEMYEGLVQAQSLLMSEVVEVVNRYILPQLMVVNFPEQWEAGVRVKMETRGFQAQDMELLGQIIQLIGQSDVDLLGVDIREALAQLDMPLVSKAEYDRRLAEKAQQAALEGPGAVEPDVGAAGVVPSTGQAPATEANTPGPGNNGASAGSFTGFTYVPAIQRIELAAANDYLLSLPDSGHYQDRTIRSLSQQLWQTMQEFYEFQYGEFSEYLDNYEGNLHLSDTEENGIELAPSDFAKDWARRVVTGWQLSSEKLQEILNRVRDLMQRIVQRSSNLTRREVGLSDELLEDDRDNWVDDRIGTVLSKSITTTRSELEDFIASQIQDEELDPRKIAEKIRAHYSDFPQWKADRFARTETRDAYNAGVLLAGKQNGLEVAQATDGQYGPTDPDCEHRNGQFFTIDAALREQEHPNGTLEWRLIKEPVTLSRVDDVEHEVPGTLAYYDEDERKIVLANSLTTEDERKFLLAIGETLAS